MKLTNAAINNFRPKNKTYRASDGHGLYIQVEPKGGKYWRLAYRFNKKQKTLPIGVYPETSLKQAREDCHAARKLLDSGVDPSEEKKRLRGFSKAERALIKQAAQNGKMSDALRVFGSRLNPIIALGSGGGAPAAAATHAGSSFFRKLAGDMQVNKAGRLADEVINGALGRGTLPAVQGKPGSLSAILAGSNTAALPKR